MDGGFHLPNLPKSDGASSRQSSRGAATAGQPGSGAPKARGPSPAPPFAKPFAPSPVYVDAHVATPDNPAPAEPRPKAVEPGSLRATRAPPVAQGWDSPEPVRPEIPVFAPPVRPFALAEPKPPAPAPAPAVAKPATLPPVPEQDNLQLLGLAPSRPLLGLAPRDVVPNSTWFAVPKVAPKVEITASAGPRDIDPGLDKEVVEQSLLQKQEDDIQRIKKQDKAKLDLAQAVAESTWLNHVHQYNAERQGRKRATPIRRPQSADSVLPRPKKRVRNPYLNLRGPSANAVATDNPYLRRDRIDGTSTRKRSRGRTSASSSDEDLPQPPPTLGRYAPLSQPKTPPTAKPEMGQLRPA